MTNALPQGDPRLLETEQAVRLLRSTIPARLAFTWTDGTPRVATKADHPETRKPGWRGSPCARRGWV
jgi:hypothetical protein